MIKPVFNDALQSTKKERVKSVFNHNIFCRTQLHLESALSIAIENSYES